MSSHAPRESEALLSATPATRERMHKLRLEIRPGRALYDAEAGVPLVYVERECERDVKFYISPHEADVLAAELAHRWNVAAEATPPSTDPDAINRGTAALRLATRYAAPVNADLIYLYVRALALIDARGLGDDLLSYLYACTEAEG